MGGRCLTIGCQLRYPHRAPRDMSPTIYILRICQINAQKPSGNKSEDDNIISDLDSSKVGSYLELQLDLFNMEYGRQVGEVGKPHSWVERRWIESHSAQEVDSDDNRSRGTLRGRVVGRGLEEITGMEVMCVASSQRESSTHAPHPCCSKISSPITDRSRQNIYKTSSPHSPQDLPHARGSGYPPDSTVIYTRSTAYKCPKKICNRILCSSNPIHPVMQLPNFFELCGESIWTTVETRRINARISSARDSRRHQKSMTAEAGTKDTAWPQCFCHLSVV